MGANLLEEEKFGSNGQKVWCKPDRASARAAVILSFLFFAFLPASWALGFWAPAALNGVAWDGSHELFYSG